MLTELEEVGGGPSATPIVLTRNVIPSLAKGLDASDLLECYALIRSAPLHGLANSTIRVQKMAMGIRYRPKVSPTGQLVKDPLELTLEYGPQRLGPLLNNEAMPFIQVEDSSSFIAWDNVGKVYYTTKIVSENFLSSYYMASMTGAVLEKILLQAVEYTERRRVYQPFSVYSEENGREIDASSSSNFTQYMWQHLANIGVEIEPIMPPPLYEARIWASSVKKVIPEPTVSHAAAIFYQKLYRCLEAIATNDYTAFMPTESPTISPMPTSMPSQVSASPTDGAIDPTSNPTGTATAAPVDPPVDSGKNHTANEPHDAGKASNFTKSASDSGSDIEESDGVDSSTDDGTGEPDSGGGDDGSVNTTAVPGEDLDETAGSNDGDGDRYMRQRYRILEDKSEENDSFDEIDNSGDIASLSGDDDDNGDAATSSGEEASGSLDGQEQSPTSPEPPDTDGTGQDVDKAQQAAQEAQMAADVAKDAAQSEGDTKAADAAQAAAHAAKAAADATSKAAAQAAMDSILSGDGAMMTSIINTCFTNPQYEIGTIDANGTVTVEAYLYRDGSRYYRLDMEKPFLEIVKVNLPLPKAKTQTPYGSGGDFVDWMLALVVLGMMALAVLVILQQMGHVYVDSLFKCQRWFFNPRKYDYEGQLGPEHHQEYSHRFGEDGIPLSMGGRPSHRSPIQQHNRTGSSSSLKNLGIDLPTLSHPSDNPRLGERPDEGMSGLGDVELCRMSSRLSSGGSISGDSVEGLPERLTRDPDLVDFPDLKSSSKVAMPVRANGNHTPTSQYRDDANKQSSGSLVSFD